MPLNENENKYKRRVNKLNMDSEQLQHNWEKIVFDIVQPPVETEW
jgi:hypothetical protein